MSNISQSKFLKKRYTACLKVNGEVHGITSGNRIEPVLEQGKEVLFPAFLAWIEDQLLSKAYPAPVVIVYQGTTAYEFIRMRVNQEWGIVVWKRVPSPSEQKKKPGPPAKDGKEPDKEKE